MLRAQILSCVSNALNARLMLPQIKFHERGLLSLAVIHFQLLSVTDVILDNNYVVIFSNVFTLSF